MLGALTFLPTFMQFVDGVSATTSGLRTLPMVAGMLITSIGSGNIVGRTGRYKVFPIAGTAIMAVAFLLLSQMNAATPTWQQSVYLFILGTGIGLCMQVLILVVQNTSKFADLGVATSGVTFFRTIGSSFGAAIFGSLFANFLAARIGPALVASGAPPRGRGVAPGAARAVTGDGRTDRRRLRRLAGHGVPVRGPRRRHRLHRLALPQGGATARGGDDFGDRLGEGFGMPSTESPEKILEVAIGRLFRDSPEIRLRSLAQQPGCHLTSPRCGGCCRSTGRTRCSDRRRSPISPNACGCHTKSSSPPSTAWSPTASRCAPTAGCGSRRPGMKQVDAISGRSSAASSTSSPSRRRSRAARTGSQVDAALERIAHRMLVQRDWTDDRSRAGRRGLTPKLERVPIL